MNMMKRLFLISATCLLCVVGAVAQIVNPVKWKSAIKMTDDSHGVITFTATIDDGWHMYSTEAVADGPVPTSVDWKELKGVKLEGGLKPDRKPQRHHDPNFGVDLSWWTGSVTLTQRFTATAANYSIKGNVGYMSCNDTQCSSPAKEPFNFSGTAATASGQTEAAADSTSATQPAAAAATVADSVSQDQLWAPVKAEPSSDSGSAATASLWYIFAACFGGGLLALLTPCVWPIIPMTVSFFLKKSGGRAKSVRNAAIYGASIIVIYLALGLAVTAVYGASELNAIATNAVCNVVFFLLLVVFAVSFFGAFEITLPSSWSNRLDSATERTTGMLSIFFMAFTLVIVSFSCTGPIIGTLLVEAATMGSMAGPAVGMGAFALALAIPFSFFAMFPSVLKRMPKSGGWLNTVKVVLGFIELALSLKFLSVADLAYGWHLLDRETFLALWIAIFGLLGLYLLGVFRFKSDGEPRQSGVGVTRFMLALASLAFTAYLVPGLWGAPLRATSAFVPPLSTQDFNLYGEELSQYGDYEQGMRAAARAGKPVLLDFSGYGCVNCRKMDGAVLDKDQVKTAIARDFVTIKLMVDDKKTMPQPVFVEENGRQVELDTYGDLWSYLQRSKFGANSQPYYVVLDAQGRLMSGPAVYDEDVNKFIDFLNKGLNNYKANGNKQQQ